MRPIRPWVVVAGCLLAIVAAVTGVVWRQGDFWRASAADYLRERLQAQFGADFQATDLRGRWLPPGISLGRVTFHRPGEPWVLTADDIRVSFNLYAILFGRERLGRVVVERPRLFVRAAAPVPAGSPGAAAAGLTPTDVGERVRELLRPPLLLRVLEVTDGRVEVLDRSGRVTVADGVELGLLLSSGNARVDLEVGRVTTAGSGPRLELGSLAAEAGLDGSGATLHHLTARGGPLTGTLQGTVDYAGGLSLTGELAAAVERVVSLAGRPGLAGGKARFTGSVTGAWRSPEAAGILAVDAPVFQGRRWPNARAAVAWSGRRLSWSDLRVAFGDGALQSAGSAEFPAGAPPRYRVDVSARAIAPALLPGLGGEPAALVRGVEGALHWEGAGLGAAAEGAGSLDARFSLAALPQEQLALQAHASLAAGVLEFDTLRAAGATVDAAGSGSWQRGAGFAARVDGTVGDVGRLVPSPPVAVGGRASFSGELAADGGGWRYAGSVRLDQAVVGKVAGLTVAARVDATGTGVRIAEASFTWPGARGSAAGTVEMPAGQLALSAVVERLSLAEAARLLGADATAADGTLSARLRVQGTIAEPEFSGQVAGGALRYRTYAADEGTLSFTYAARRLGVSRLRLRRGATELSFRGELTEGRTLAGDFESAAFAWSDFVPDSRLELAGTLRGQVEGPLEAPVIKSTLKVGRLRYAGFDLRGGELAVDYRGGKAAVTGWIAGPENRLRAVLEPAQGWRFESELQLQQFAPEIVRSGAAAFPPAVGKIVGQAAFLAAGRLHADGRLVDAASIRAAASLETFWLEAGGSTLQNRAPVRFSWRDGVLSVEDFRLAGDQYHLEIEGGGGPAGGWDLRAAGAVNLALLTRHWKDLEQVEGLGDLRLALGGPWAAPVPEGSLVVHDAFVKLRPLEEPLEHLEGRVDLHEGTLVASGLSGSIGGGAFRGRGSYRFAQETMDVEVEGKLDLALFRSRVPAARELRGPVDVRLRLVGPLAAPVFSGDVEIVNAELFARPFPAKITRLRGKLRLGADGLEVQQLDGQTGGGTVSLSGSLAWSPAPGKVDLRLRGTGILVSLADGLKAQADLDLGLRGVVPDLQLAGEVRVLKARYLREFGEKPPPLVPSGNGDGAGRRVDLARTTLDVKVRATDNVWIANKMAKIEASVALDVGGTLAAPSVRGEITGIQGEAFYLSRKFRLESGSLRFVPPAAVPLLDLQASTSVGETQILFLMDGPLNDLSYHLVSLPAMRQEDLVALLTIGETRGALARGGERASAVGAAVFTTEPLVNALGDEARSSMGLEVLQVEPIVGDDNQVSARVTLGTHLSDRLFVSYSQNLGATEDQQVAVQYYLLDYLSLWGQELRQGIYSLDVVFRYSFR